MHYEYSTEKLINLQGVKVKNIEILEKVNKIHIDLVKKECTCPVCKSKTSKVHDYRVQKIKDVPSFSKQIVLILRKRRYVCKNCGKKFYEKLDFLQRYSRMSIRVLEEIFKQLSNTVSYTSVAKKLNISTSTVIRVFDALKYAKPSKTPRVLGIDEFKGNAGGEKYLAILTDVENKKVIDILPNRNYDYLLKYFNKINRANTEFFVSDMWKPYRNLKSVHFEKSKLITDKYHFVRQVIWDFEKVRKEEQKRFSKKYRLTFKRSKILLTKRFYSLNRDEVQKVKNIFRISPRLQEAHDLKEDFLNILKEKDFSAKCEQLKTGFIHLLSTKFLSLNHL